MVFKETKLKGAYIIELEPIQDERGFFARSFCQKEFRSHGIDMNIVQCNISYNKKKGTLRGMHYQSAPYEEAKLVTCIKGAIYDVIIDLRPDSDTYCQWIAVELTASSSQLTAYSSQLPAPSLQLTAHGPDLSANRLPLTAHGSYVSADRLQLTAHCGMLYVPKGFAHGFLTLEDNTEVFYQMSEFYVPGYGRGIRWNDTAFRIKWPGEVNVISNEDKKYPDFSG